MSIGSYPYHIMTFLIGPREYVTDLIAYLETTFACMVFMPDAVREAVHFTSCKHIANSLVVCYICYVPSNYRVMSWIMSYPMTSNVHGM